jgi:hypothetical protein
MNPDLIQGALRSRLVRLGAAMILAGLVQMGTNYYGKYLSPEMQGLITSIFGAVVVWLRAGTTQALEDRQ